MTLTLPLTAAEAAMLLAKAHSEGTTLEELVRHAIDPLLALADEDLSPLPRRRDSDEDLERMIDTLPEMPVLPESSLTREGIYGQDDRR